MEDESFFDLISYWWNMFTFSGSASFIFAKKLQSLKNWSKDKFFGVESRLSEFERAIEILDSKEETQQLSQQEFSERISLIGKHNDVSHLVHQKMESRAKINWIEKGERNTSYFHVVANGRKRANWIHRIEVDGREFVAPADIQEEAISSLSCTQKTNNGDQKWII